MRRILGLAALALLVGAPAASAAPHITLKPSALRVLAGNSVALSGRVTGKPPGTRVEVLARRYGRSSPRTVAVVHTRAGGRFVARVRPTVQTAYEFRDAATVSNRVVIHVEPKLSIRELGDGRIWGHVSAGKRLAGRHVQLQQLRGGAWHTIAKAKLTHASSALFGPLSASPGGPVRLALSVNQAGRGLLGATSHALGYHTYTLTLEPSAFRVLYGHAVTLHGRLWNGRAGEPVVLKVWTFGHSSPRTLATIETGANGRWSFRTTPRVQTSYQASWTSLHVSARERVGVAPVIAIRRLAGQRVWTQVAAGRSLAGRTVKLQRLVAPGVWQTVAQKPLGRGSSTVFAVNLPASSLRVALSVNEAGPGYLAGFSRTLVYKP